jgi:hypothetical protein
MATAPKEFARSLSEFCYITHFRLRGPQAISRVFGSQHGRSPEKQVSVILDTDNVSDRELGWGKIAVLLFDL